MKVWCCLKTSFKSRGSLVVECLPPVPPVPILAVHKNASVLILLILGFVFFQTQSSFYRDKMRWLLVTLILFEPLIAAPRTEQQQGRIKRQTQVIKKIRGVFSSSLFTILWFRQQGSVWITSTRDSSVFQSTSAAMMGSSGPLLRDFLTQGSKTEMWKEREIPLRSTSFFQEHLWGRSVRGILRRVPRRLLPSRSVCLFFSCLSLV